VTGIFLQARMQSSRLPGKALLEIAGKTVLEHAMLSLRKIPVDHYVVITDSASKGVFSTLTAPCGFSVFCGSDEDVLDRYVQAGKFYKTDVIVRATGDNPLVSWEIGRATLELRSQTQADYAGYLGPPLGCCVEAYSFSSLERANSESKKMFDHEHVSPYILDNPHLFKIERPSAGEEYLCPDGRATLDTPEDYSIISRIFDDLYRGDTISTLELVQWLKIHHCPVSNPS
jgi:spore coat polysaccharide biosynthesis protein SpsF